MAVRYTGAGLESAWAFFLALAFCRRRAARDLRGGDGVVVSDMASASGEERKVVRRTWWWGALVVTGRLEKQTSKQG